MTKKKAFSRQCHHLCFPSSQRKWRFYSGSVSQARGTVEFDFCFVPRFGVRTQRQTAREFPECSLSFGGNRSFRSSPPSNVCSCVAVLHHHVGLETDELEDEQIDAAQRKQAIESAAELYTEAHRRAIYLLETYTAKTLPEVPVLHMVRECLTVSVASMLIRTLRACLYTIFNLSPT